MQRVVIDTNVFVSALIQRSYPYQIVNELFIESKIQLCISEEIFAEYYEVLNRKKFSNYPEFVSNAKLLLANIERKAPSYAPTSKVKIINDLDDILEA